MGSGQSKGKLTRWNDDRGFGFIKPDDGGPDVFLDIGDVQPARRPPQVGDTISYKKIVAPDGKVRAAHASMPDVTSPPSPSPVVRPPSRPSRPATRRTSSTPRSSSQHRSIEKIIGGVLSLVGVGFLLTEFAPVLWSLGGIFTPESRCTIKGNISIDTGRKIYHLPGMEDYASTRIEPVHGEQWFCSEEDAISKGWSKAPR